MESNLSFYEKLAECANVLSEQGQEVTGSFKTRINQIKKIIKQLNGRRDDNSIKGNKGRKKESLRDICAARNLLEAVIKTTVVTRRRSKFQVLSRCH